MVPEATQSERQQSSDEDLVRLVRGRDEGAVRELTRRYNRRWFRLARGIVRDDAEAEDVVQEVYGRAFTGLDTFRGDAAFGTWLTRIAVNEALGRLRKRRPVVEWTDDIDSGSNAVAFSAASRPIDPERRMAVRELQAFVESAIDTLPEPFRVVFVARVVEGLGVDETATLFDLRPETVKTRVFRARQMIRAELERSTGSALSDAFSFDGERCARMTEAVVEVWRRASVAG